MTEHRCSCGETFATAGELFDHVETHEAKRRRASGPCPICRAFVTVEIDNATPDVRELAAEHDPKCAAELAERNRKPLLDIDLWER